MQRFVNPDDCFWKDVYGKHNDWYIFNVKPTGDDEESIETYVTEARNGILRQMGTAMSVSLDKGKIGAVSSPKHDKAPNRYFLVEFINEPGPADKQCNTYELNVVLGANKWVTRPEKECIVDMINVVDTDAKVEPISAQNMPPQRIRRQVTHHIVVKISEESHNFAIDEMRRRYQLGYGPKLVASSGEADEVAEEEN